MTHVTSPRLPGVPILMPRASGPEYSRWRRGVQFVLESKGMWKYCDGSLPMPMPKTRRSSTVSTKKTNDTQPSLLEERRAWVRQDREVKLDIFLSLAEEVMLDVFEVGPPLPPTNHSAQQLLEALDEHFAVFNFESYHHAFCHFLNLHIDQYTSMQDFNQEFITVLEDLLDHGHPLSNAQACSAYFSKLRCTQNPWVAQKLEQLSSSHSINSKYQFENEPNIQDLMQESPPWSCVRPLATKSSQTFHTQHRRQQQRHPIPEPQGSEEQTSSPNTSRSSSLSNSSSTPAPLHSSSISTLPSAPSSRPLSNTTTRSQEIIVYASKSAGGPGDLDARALHAALEKLSSAPITTTPPTPPTPPPTVPLKQQQQQPKSDSITPPWLAPLHRPLPPLPPPSPPAVGEVVVEHTADSHIAHAASASASSISAPVLISTSSLMRDTCVTTYLSTSTDMDSIANSDSTRSSDLYLPLQGALVTASSPSPPSPPPPPPPRRRPAFSTSISTPPPPANRANIHSHHKAGSLDFHVPRLGRDGSTGAGIGVIPYTTTGLGGGNIMSTPKMKSRGWSISRLTLR
ncbi:hypothetical protein P3342_007962 [Pyrenophora teres f. teres]|nr:hypothetical protein P3342_007962 [Pyrenophora teres f. teres]